MSSAEAHLHSTDRVVINCGYIFVSTMNTADGIYDVVIRTAGVDIYIYQYSNSLRKSLGHIRMQKVYANNQVHIWVIEELALCTYISVCEQLC